LTIPVVEGREGREGDIKVKVRFKKVLLEHVFLAELF